MDPVEVPETVRAACIERARQLITESARRSSIQLVEVTEIADEGREFGPALLIRARSTTNPINVSTAQVDGLLMPGVYDESDIEDIAAQMSAMARVAWMEDGLNP